MKAMTRARNAARAVIPTTVRNQVMRQFGANQLFRRIIENTGELDVIRAEYGRLTSGQEWSGFGSGVTTLNMTERVVEVPWVLSRYRGEETVLDVGPAYAVTWYTRQLARLRIRELHGIDLRPVRIKGMRVSVGDVRNLPYEDGYFELVTCISTLEHVGLENRDQYGASGALSGGGDVQGLREFGRVLKKGGRVLITVPFGRLQHFDWMTQYDLRTWNQLLTNAGFTATELALYEYSPDDGWRLRGTPTGLESGEYQGAGAPAATGVLCAAVSRLQ